MGFRSTFVTSDYYFDWPEWFVKQYEKIVNFQSEKKGCISSRLEGKTYGLWSTLVEDIQRAIPWGEYTDLKFVLIFLHECGGITRVQIEQDAIYYTEPSEWSNAEYTTHSYCYGCSDAPWLSKQDGLEEKYGAERQHYFHTNQLLRERIDELNFQVAELKEKLEAKNVAVQENE